MASTDNELHSPGSVARNSTTNSAECRHVQRRRLRSRNLKRLLSLLVSVEMLSIFLLLISAPFLIGLSIGAAIAVLVASTLLLSSVLPSRIVVVVNASSRQEVLGALRSKTRAYGYDYENASLACNEIRFAPRWADLPIWTENRISVVEVANGLQITGPMVAVSALEKEMRAVHWSGLVLVVKRVQYFSI